MTLALKQTAAILFFIVLLFNFYGYRVVIGYLQSNSEVQLEKQVDNNQYNEHELISIKTKLDLAYYTSSPEYERAYGSITIEGINYQYVKRRIYNDTLELLCLPNEAKTKMQSVKNEITKSFADGQTSAPKKNTTIKITLPDFCQAIKTFSASCFLKKQDTFSVYQSPLSMGYATRQKRPPKSALLIFC